MDLPQDVMKVVEAKVDTKLAATLSYAKRKKMPKSQFALPKEKKPGEPGKGAYPIPDVAHARNALARVSQHGSPAERAKVRSKVYSKFPQLRERHQEREGKDPMEHPTAKKISSVQDSDLLALMTKVENLAFQEAKLAYQQKAAQYGPDDYKRSLLDKFREVRERDVPWPVGLAGIAGGYMGATRLTDAMKRRAEALTREMDYVGRRKGLLRRMRQRAAQREVFKAPWWATKTRGEISKRLGRPTIVPRASLRWGARVLGPLAGLWAAKGLMGTPRKPTYQELEAKYGSDKKAAIPKSERSLAKRADVGDWAARHPFLTAAGGALAGAALPWAMREAGSGLDKLTEGSAYLPYASIPGAIAGGVAGLTASHLARKRRERMLRQKAMRDQARQQRMLMEAAYAGYGPFAGG